MDKDQEPLKVPSRGKVGPLIIMIAGLILTLAVAAVYLVFKKGGLKKTAEGAVGPVKVTRSVSGGVPVLQMRYLSGYHLDGIVVGGRSSHVVINGKELHQGDYIDSLEVRNITSSSVELYDSKRNASGTLTFSF